MNRIQLRYYKLHREHMGQYKLYSFEFVLDILYIERGFPPPPPYILNTMNNLLVQKQ